MNNLMGALSAGINAQQEARIFALELMLKSLINTLTSEQLENVKESLNAYLPTKGTPGNPIDDESIEQIRSLCSFFFNGKPFDRGHSNEP